MSITITGEMVEAGLQAFSRHHSPLKSEAYIEAVIADVAPLIEAAVRERCAAIAEDYEEWAQGWGTDKNLATAQTVSAEIATAIRANGGVE